MTSAELAKVEASLIAETRVLFLARRNLDHPVAAPAFREALPMLCRSRNAAIATEARRLFGRLERRRLGCGDAA